MTTFSATKATKLEMIIFDSFDPISSWLNRFVSVTIRKALKDNPPTINMASLIDDAAKNEPLAVWLDLSGLNFGPSFALKGNLKELFDDQIDWLADHDGIIRNPAAKDFMVSLISSLRCIADDIEGKME